MRLSNPRIETGEIIRVDYKFQKENLANKKWWKGGIETLNWKKKQGNKIDTVIGTGTFGGDGGGGVLGFGVSPISVRHGGVSDGERVRWSGKLVCWSLKAQQKRHTRKHKFCYKLLSRFVSVYFLAFTRWNTQILLVQI